MLVGTILNALGILVGGVVGLTANKQLSPARQNILKIGMGALTVFFGLQMTVLSLRGSLPAWIKQLLIVILAMMVGKVIGRLLRLQKRLNRLGQFAKGKLAQAQSENPQRMSDGLI